MKASLNWIKEFVDVDVPAQEIADRLSMTGLEIEEVQSLGEGLDPVLTATLLKVEKHPNADRLTLCEVRCGSNVVSVVCGAKNMKAGDKVVLALPGATLPNGLTIKESVIRKVKSNGMLCSESELGLSEESEGIMILPPETPEGVQLQDALPIRDTIMEINVTPNRGDCLSMVGLAREVAGNYHLKLKPREIRQDQWQWVKETVKVNNKAQDLCPRYTCRILRGVKVGASPLWMKQRLESCGIRSINNVVDSTNYAMLETGQPLHAFDFKQIKKKTVVVRQAKKKEIMKTLDGEERHLLDTDLVIADGERVLALAGVMGGEDSGIEDSTTDLLLESACFSPQSVRKTAKRFALQTESSYRFERSVDPNGCSRVLDRLTELILETAGGDQVGEVVDDYSKPVNPILIPLRTGQIERILGIKLSTPEILKPLAGLGIAGNEIKEGEISFEVPTFRSDLTREIDLMEEVARLTGYDQIPVTYPRIHLSELLPPEVNEFDQMDRLRQILIGWGFSEVIHYSFTSPELLKTFGLKIAEEQTLLNPISEEMSVMRPALVPQMVQTLQNNIFRGNKNLKLFEIRPVYSYSGREKPPYQERWRLCLGVSGSRRPPHFLEKEEGPVPEGLQGLTLLDLKGYLKSMLHQVRPDENFIEKEWNSHYFHPNRQALLEVSHNGNSGKPQPLGYLGRLHPALMEEMGLSVPVIMAEIYLDLFLTEWKNSIQFQEISPFPTVWRDLNLIVQESTPNGSVLEVIRSQGGAWVRRVELLDVYRGKPLEPGKKALTYRIEYGAADRTLTDEEVNLARGKLLEILNQEIGATLR